MELFHKFPFEINSRAFKLGADLSCLCTLTKPKIDDIVILHKVMVKYIVYDLKSVGALEIEFIAPIPEQIATTTVRATTWSSGNPLIWTS